MNTLGVLSMLHEDANDNSATRRFRDQPVLWWTLARLSAVEVVKDWTILCWSDQADAVAACTGSSVVTRSDNGPRVPISALDSLTASSRWLDGWRGGLLQTCDFDAGFHAPSLLKLTTTHDAFLLIDPAASLVDSQLVCDTMAHSESHPNERLVFTPAAPGLNGVLLRASLVQQLAATSAHPGRLLSYLHDQPGKDPIARNCCAPVPTKVARTTKRFKLDTLRQVHRLEREMESLNGQLLRTAAEDLVRHAEADTELDPIPREITLELTTARQTNPIFSPLRHSRITRPDLDSSHAARLFAELAEYPDTRITFAGLGDPLLHPRFEEIVTSARDAGLRALHLETDLLGISPDRLTALATLPLDVISFHVPAVTQETYAKIMGVDAYLQFLENLKTLITARHAAGNMVPVIVPTFVKCRDNLHEMERWYDQWLRVIGSAVITAPTAHAGLVPAESIGISHMAPPKRRPCARLSSRLTLRSDGSASLCEETLPTPHTTGNFPTLSIKELWASLNPARTQHAQGRYEGPCATCTEWHRP